MNLVAKMTNKGAPRTTTKGTPAPKGPIASSNSKVNKSSSIVRSSSSAKGGAYMKKSKRKSMKKSTKQ